MYFQDMLKNDILWTSVLAWFVAQVIKVFLVLAEEKRFDIRRFVGSGGMPSSHSSFVVSLAVSVGLSTGFSSVEFAICLCVAMVVMYDAAGVRRSTGEQAKILNIIIEDLSEGNYSRVETKLKEFLGHTPIEVFAGCILGIFIAILRHA